MRPLALILAGAFLATAPVAAATPNTLNTQFAETGAQSLTIVNTERSARTLYARFEFPDDPDNRNYGFVQRVAAGESLTYYLPEGTRVFACDGRYWDDYRPNEREVALLDADTQLTITAAEFRP